MYKRQLTYSAYDDGGLAEIFIRMSKQGSTLAGLLDAFAIAVSVALQYGVPLENFVRRFSYARFEPAGYTDNPDVQVATSIVDYLSRYLGLRFLSAGDLDNLGIKASVKEIEAESKGAVEVVTQIKIKESSVRVREEIKRVTYADSVCRACGGMMIQTGTCKTCMQCGTSNGGC